MERVTRPVEAGTTNAQMMKRLQAITESAHDMIATFDLRGRIMYLNRAGFVYLGIGDLNGANGQLETYMSTQTTLRLVKGLREALERGFWHAELDWIAADGSVLTTSQTIVAHLAEHGDEPYFSTIARDISERKQFERRLLSAKQEADEANETKSRFLARASHEIRTPLNGIIGFVHLLQRTGLNDTQRQYVRQIEHASKRLLHILSDVLDYTRVEANKLTIESVSFRLSECLDRLSGTFAVLLGPKPVDLLIGVAGDVPDRLTGDPARLEQVLLNLVGNAIKFTDKGMISLEIVAADRSDSAVTLGFTVADTGYGMTDEQLANLFQPFAQAEAGRSQGGTGLGLVISNKLIERMGGTGLRAESRYREGSVFRFELPFAAKDDDLLPAWGTEGMRVLVTEDNPVLSDHWLQSLREIGCEAEATCDWEGAKRRMAERQWDVWITDMEADDMHGEHTWIEWKIEADKRGIPVLCSTSMPGRDALAMLPEHVRPDGVVLKPATRHQIREALVRLKDRRSNGGLSDDSIDPLVEGAPFRYQGNVLVIDDDDINRLVWRIMLERIGLGVTEAADGKTALNHLRSRAFDLVLLDLQLPDVNGEEVAREIRSNGRWSSLPIVAVTGEDPQQVRDACRAAGINEVLGKPLDPDTLELHLQRWLLIPPAESPVYDASGETVDWPGSDELDMKAALKRLDGKKALYVRLLGRFRQEYANLREQLLELQASEDPAARIRLLHSFRGAASHLGGNRAALAAKMLEEALGSGQPSEPLFDRLVSRVDLLMDAIGFVIQQKK